MNYLSIFRERNFNPNTTRELIIVSPNLLGSDKHPCPNCKKNSVGYVSRPTDSGWPNQHKAICLFCSETYLMDSFNGRKRII